MLTGANGEASRHRFVRLEIGRGLGLPMYEVIVHPSGRVDVRPMRATAFLSLGLSLLLCRRRHTTSPTKARIRTSEGLSTWRIEFVPFEHHDDAFVVLIENESHHRSLISALSNAGFSVNG